MKKIPKIISERIAYYANMLPNHNTATGYEQQTISGLDLYLTGTKEVDGVDLDLNKTYIINVPVAHRVNHEQRMATAYKANGKEGVFNYISKFLEAKHINQLRYEIFSSGSFDEKLNPEVVFKRNKKIAEEKMEELEAGLTKYRRIYNIKYNDPLTGEHEKTAESLSEQASKVLGFVAQTKIMDGLSRTTIALMDDLINHIYDYQRRITGVKN
jgi:archaellin